MLKVKPHKITYTDINRLPPDFTEKMDIEYSWMAKMYDTFMVVFPLWKKWIKKVIPHIHGNKILEVSFGSGYLMTKYAAANLEIHGIEYNREMLELTRKKLKKLKISANLERGNVEKLPYPDNSFDTVVNTMAFTAYPNGEKAMSELRRVLKPNGLLLIVDFNFPKNRNIFGYWFVKIWERLGDIIKNIDSLLRTYKFEYKAIPVGGFGSVQLYIAQKIV